MDVQDGFILGVYNYCDRWCERCPFTGRCRVFADQVEREFEEDHGPLTEPMYERQAAQLAGMAERWEKRFGIDLAKIEEEALKDCADDEEYELPEVRLEHLELNERALDYAARLMQWLDGRSSDNDAVRDALEVLRHFSIFVPSKIRRALTGLADRQVPDPEEYDSNGSAKAALVGLDRMQAAWRVIVDARHVDAGSATVLIDETNWLIAQTERHLPKARAFIRPAFDEPDQVRALDGR